MSERTLKQPGDGRVQGWPTAGTALLFLAFAVLGFGLLRDAFHGPFVSNDIGCVVTNPYLRELGIESLVAFFDPASAARIHALGSYSPIDLLLHAIEYQIFTNEVFGYHPTNVAVQAGASAVLGALPLRSGLSRAAARLEQWAGAWIERAREREADGERSR